MSKMELSSGRTRKEDGGHKDHSHGSGKDLNDEQKSAVNFEMNKLFAPGAQMSNRSQVHFATRVNGWNNSDAGRRAFDNRDDFADAVADEWERRRNKTPTLSRIMMNELRLSRLRAIKSLSNLSENAKKSLECSFCSDESLELAYSNDALDLQFRETIDILKE